jgi:hypothetical protein
MATFQSVWYRLVLLFFAVYLTVLWFVLGPGNRHASGGPPAWPYAVSVLSGTCSLVPAVPTSIMRRVPRQWFRVPKGERVLHRIVGVGIFAWLLDISGWNRHVLEPLRGFSGKRASLLSLELSARASAISHGICFVIHVLLAVLAPFSRHPWSAALWLLWPGIVVHLYPVLLQRSIMLRLQPLLDKMAPADCVGR